ncbi:hypothetical protein KUCAC02_036224 [Chaenocephalus aceratus]|nr:hypothetical protein KUCAC02_036224 [Chaenocephalus aceratus]
MSIEVGSTVSEDLGEMAERFYTPGSSTEVSQPIAESFQTPKSHMSFRTPSSDTSGGFRTPKEYPFSPMDHKRPSTGGSSERFFLSPVQFLMSPGDEGIETVDDNLYLTKGLGPLGVSSFRRKCRESLRPSSNLSSRRECLKRTLSRSTPRCLACLPPR